MDRKKVAIVIIFILVIVIGVFVFISANTSELKVSTDLVSRLQLCISELRVAGFGEEQIIDLCRRLYKDEYIQGVR